MNELIDILDELACDIDFHEAIASDDEIKSEKSDMYFDKLKNVYRKIDRHRYSDISKYINEQKLDAVDILRDNVACIIEYAIKNFYDKFPEEDRTCFVKLNKLYDHIELEVARYSSLKQMELLAQDHDNKAKLLKEDLKVMETTVSDTQEKSKHLTEQLISILGIFAGIIVTFSFATSAAGEAVVGLIKGDILYWGFILCILGVVFINTLAFLLSFVTKLSGHKFSSTFPWLTYIVSNVAVMSLAIILLFNM